MILQLFATVFVFLISAPFSHFCGLFAPRHSSSYPQDVRSLNWWNSWAFYLNPQIPQVINHQIFEHTIFRQTQVVKIAPHLGMAASD